MESSESYISSMGVIVNRCFRKPPEATGGEARAPGERALDTTPTDERSRQPYIQGSFLGDRGVGETGPP
jgi:hypothetical protein